jgi:hypothetical protein
MSENWISNWGQALGLAGCEQCDWIYLLPLDKLPLTCPHCGQEELVAMDETADSPTYTHPPELLLPFTVNQTTLESQMKQFASGIWIAPKDLNVTRLLGRLQPMYMPMWLVDAEVQAQWQAEVGFDYQVVSHREKNVNGRWHSQEIKKTKVRWEPRVGTLSRRYDNTTAPALEDHNKMMSRLGQFDRRKAQPFEPVADALVRLPNRLPEDAWPEATAVLQTIAGDDCRRAANGEHVRDFKWSADFAHQNWTQLLLPLYTTYYLDDEGQPQVLLVNGQTGILDGRKRASMKRAFQWGTVVAVIAAVLFIVGTVLSLVGEAGVTGIGRQAITLSFFGVLLAFVPIIYAWHFNQTQ